jgi:hypothetical protein
MNSNTLRVSQYLNEARRKKKSNYWWDDNRNGIGWEPNEVRGHFRRKKKKSVKEGYSNWREDLSEIAEIAEIGKEKNTEKIVEKEVKNIIEINPRINTGDRLSGMSANECVEKMGGTLLEMEEYSQECILEELNPLELLAVTDELLEEVVYEFFIEALEEGYELEEIEESILESIENSFQLLTEEDNPRKRGVLSRLKRFAKGAAKKIARAPGYLAGLGARALVRGAQELGKGAVRGYKGAEKDDDDEEEAPSRSRVTQSASTSQRQAEPSRSRGGTSTQSQSQPRRRVQVTQSSSERQTEPSRSRVTQSASEPRVRQTARDGVRKGLRKTLSNLAYYAGHKLSPEHGKPHQAQSKAGVRAAKTYRGVGAGKKVEVAGESGERNKEPEVKKVSVSDVTSSQAHSKPGVRTPRPYSSSNKKPTAKRTTVSVSNIPNTKPEAKKPRRRRGGGGASTSVSTPPKSPKGGGSQSKALGSEKSPKSEPNPKKKDKPSLDDLLKSVRTESYQLTEKSESEQQQKLFGLALSVKRGTTPRSEVSSAVLKIVDTMTEKQIRDFAKTKHEGIPKKVTKEEAIREELTIRMLAKIIEQSDSMPIAQPTTKTGSKSIINSKKRLLQQQLNSLNKGVDIDV